MSRAPAPRATPKSIQIAASFSIAVAKIKTRTIERSVRSSSTCSEAMDSHQSVRARALLPSDDANRLAMPAGSAEMSIHRQLSSEMGKADLLGFRAESAD